MPEAYHLGLSEKAARGAVYALLPVDPIHVAEAAKLLDEDYGVVATERGFVSQLGSLAGAPVLVVSSGIGGPSVSVVAHELSNLGVHTMIGVGAMGAIQPDVEVGDLVVATGAVRLDGASIHYAPVAYPALADHQVFARLRRAAEDLGHKAHCGVCASTDTFYPGQERYDHDGQHVVSALRGSLVEWRQLGVLGYDMESATLLTFAAVTGARAGVVKAVVVNRARRETVHVEAAAGAEPRAVEVAVAALRKLIKKET